MQEEYNVISTDASKVNDAQILLGTINNLSNGIKAYTGILGGLENPVLMGRKQSMEDEIKSKSPGINYWSDIEASYDNLAPHTWAISCLLYTSPSPRD